MFYEIGTLNWPRVNNWCNMWHNLEKVLQSVDFQLLFQSNLQSHLQPNSLNNSLHSFCHEQNYGINKHPITTHAQCLNVICFASWVAPVLLQHPPPQPPMSKPVHCLWLTSSWNSLYLHSWGYLVIINVDNNTRIPRILWSLAWIVLLLESLQKLIQHFWVAKKWPC